MIMKNKTISNIIKVSISNIFSLLTSILVGFLLPKILNISDYGYYKTFTLYVTYVGLLHFGIISGIYLKYGGTDYKELPLEKFRLYTKFIFFIELALSVLFFLLSFILLNDEIRIVFYFVACFVFLTNVSTYYQTISQITLRFRELSNRTFILSVLQIFLILICYILFHFGVKIDYLMYIFLYTLINLFIVLWYFITYKDIFFGKSSKFKDGKNEIINFLKSGFPLMIANLCSTLIMTLDRQFVNVLFDNNTYAIYAFAYNLLSMITTITSAISMVIFPSLKKIKEEDVKHMYSRLISIISIVGLFFINSFYPLHIFINWFLPQYSSSLNIFKIILPGIAISSCITIVMHNFYKVLNINNLFFIKSLIALFVSLVANIVAYFIFGTTIAISIASVLCIAIWYIISNLKIVKITNEKSVKNIIYLFGMCIVFYALSLLNNEFLSAIIYFIIYCIITIIFYRKDINSAFKITKNK